MSSTLSSMAARSGDPVAYIKAFRQSGQELALASDILRNRALDAILSNAEPVDENGNPVDLSLKVNECRGRDHRRGEIVACLAEEEEE